MTRRLTLEEFIERSRKVHGDKYNYDKVIYKNNSINVIINCIACNKGFLQQPAVHMRGSGCGECAIKVRTKTNKMFIEEAIAVHGDRFDYSRVNYINSNTHVNITCNICNWSFPVAPGNHLGGSGCPKCIAPNIGKTTEEAIDDCIAVHGDKYSYEKLVYISGHRPFIVLCPSHGEFTTDYHHFVTRRQGCAKCADRVTLTKDEFIKRARKVHGDRYNYDKVIYTCNKDPIEIICNLHGSYYQSANMHVSHGNGCPSCRNKTEGRVKEFLQRNFPDIEIIHDKMWKEVYGTRRPDFRIPSMKLILEVDGQQHFEQVAGWNPHEHTQLVDTWKSLKALYADHSVIRIHHLLMDKDNWEDILLPLIHEYETPPIMVYRLIYRTQGSPQAMEE